MRHARKHRHLLLQGYVYERVGTEREFASEERRHAGYRTVKPITLGGHRLEAGVVLPPESGFTGNRVGPFQLSIIFPSCRDYDAMLERGEIELVDRERES